MSVPGVSKYVSKIQDLLLNYLHKIHVSAPKCVTSTQHAQLFNTILHTICQTITIDSSKNTCSCLAWRYMHCLVFFLQQVFPSWCWSCQPLSHPHLRMASAATLTTSCKCKQMSWWAVWRHWLYVGFIDLIDYKFFFIPTAAGSPSLMASYGRLLFPLPLFCLYVL